ncbi:hypothetical protein LWI29_035649 [Acer saccharum]|uniref:Uncharacterized protein n=1 Tax=Acer saccharum TaxID=4024 RepID=A0AA39SZC6_ACESA|nr:hypothetical protein LWI29_035649 [Acer saccharum]
METALCNLYSSVKNLKENSLLIDAPNESKESADYGIQDDERFAMHDVVYDVARLIECEKGNVCIVIDDVITQLWVKKNKLENCISITLHNIGDLPKELRLKFQSSIKEFDGPLIQFLLSSLICYVLLHNDSEDYDLEDCSDSSESLEMLKEDNELNKATQQLDDEADVQSSNKDCEGSSSRHLERGDPV